MVRSGASVLPDLAAPPAQSGDDLDRCFQPAPARPEVSVDADLHGAAHLVVGGRAPGLLSCFELSDLLVADVSAVVSDWLATGRPYAILNPSGLPAADLHAAAPSTSAAALIGPGLDELDGVLADLRSGSDPMAAARTALAAHLLGPLGDDARTRFRDAVTALGEGPATAGW
jgi:hypothetical protein